MGYHTWQRLESFLSLPILFNLALVSHLAILDNLLHVMIQAHLTCGRLVVSLEVRVTMP